MSIIFEMGGKFWVIPQYRKHGYVHRIFWLWFGAAWMPVTFAEFINQFGAAVKLYNEKDGGDE